MSKPINRQVIERARNYLAARSTWTRFTLALTGNNRHCEPTDARATRFCAHGALVRAGFDVTGDIEQAHRLAGKAALTITGEPTLDQAYGKIYALNDGPPVTSRKAILQLFDAGLARV